MTGWIRLHRRMLGWEWYSDLNCSRVFFHLLLTANYKPTRYAGQEIPAGSRVCGYPSLARETGLSVRQIRVTFDKLKLTGELTVKRHSKFSIVSITNWSQYQSDDSHNVTQMTEEWQDVDRPVTPSKERKKERKEDLLSDVDIGPRKAARKKRNPYPDDFEVWWTGYPTDALMSKAETFKAWQKLDVEDREKATQSLEPFRAWLSRQVNYRTLHACRFLSQRRFDGFAEQPKPRLVHSSSSPKRIAAHETPDLFNLAVSWAEQHSPDLIRHGQEFITVPGEVAGNLHEQIQGRAGA